MRVYLNLTLTRVVFEFALAATFIKAVAHLTLTRVVFELQKDSA